MQGELSLSVANYTVRNPIISVFAVFTVVFPAGCDITSFGIKD
jgi:hypothetical protein